MIAQKFTPTQDYDGNNDSNRWLVNMGMRNLNSVATGAGKGWGFCTVCPSYLAKFEAGDSRRVASVIDLAAEGMTSLSDFNASWKDWREYTGYTVKKYTPLVYGNGLPGTDPTGSAGFQECNPQPWVIMRYADVLLMAAELGSPNAQSYFDQVRQRAGLTSISVSQDNIMKERAVEFAFEGIRYWDLMRQANGGEINAVADAIVASGGKVQNGGVDGTVSFERSKIIEKKGLCQIPYDQITLSNGVLKQNAGW